jgi:hypothetical protein
MILPYGVSALLKKQDVKVLGMLDGVKIYMFTLIPRTESVTSAT